MEASDVEGLCHMKPPSEIYIRMLGLIGSTIQQCNRQFPGWLYRKEFAAKGGIVGGGEASDDPLAVADVSARSMFFSKDTREGI